jgi:hypothetical protein
MLRTWLIVLIAAVAAVPWVFAFRWIKNRPASEDRGLIGYLETLAFAVLAAPVYLVTVVLVALQFLCDAARSVVRATTRFWFEQVLQEQ